MKNLSLFLSIFFYQFLFCQESVSDQLAKEYFELREYQKAEVSLKELFAKDPVRYYEMTYKTYLSLRKYNEAIAICKEVLKRDKKNVNYLYDLGLVYYKLKDTTNAGFEWMKAIEIAKDNTEQSQKLIELFKNSKNWRYVETMILKSLPNIGAKQYHEELLIDAYLAQKIYTQAVDLILRRIEVDEVNYISSMMRMQSVVDDPELIQIVQRKVYGKYSQNPNSEKWLQMAMWLSQITKDHEEALMISKAYDKRVSGNGTYVLSVADVAYNEGEYEVAINGYHYLTGILTNNSMVKLGFEKEIETYYTLLNQKLTKDSSIISTMMSLFDKYFTRYSMDYTTAEMQLLKAEIMVKYLNELDSGIHILKRLSSFVNLSKSIRSRTLLNLGDYMLIAGDMWEASLLYGQVDKEEKDSPLGEEARFKNSKVFYFNADFELAADLLSILKSSTTELLANDALYLSVFIQENLDSDTFRMAMKDISRAELLFYQNKSPQAMAILRDIKQKYPDSKLLDDIIMIEGLESLKAKDYKKAADLFLQIKEYYPTSILADKAIFEWAKIQEVYFGSTEKAIEGYLSILTKYKDSVFTSEARKRLRNLRGEKEDESS